MKPIILPKVPAEVCGANPITNCPIKSSLVLKL